MCMVNSEAPNQIKQSKRLIQVYIGWSKFHETYIVSNVMQNAIFKRAIPYKSVSSNFTVYSFSFTFTSKVSESLILTGFKMITCFLAPKSGYKLHLVSFLPTVLDDTIIPWNVKQHLKLQIMTITDE